MTNPVVELLTNAADVLTEGGWQQRSLGGRHRRDSPHCAVGALQCAAAGVYSTQYGPYAAAVRWLYKVLPLRRLQAHYTFERELLIEHWNDGSGVTAEDVQLLFKQAIAAAEGDPCNE